MVLLKDFGIYFWKVAVMSSIDRAGVGVFGPNLTLLAQLRFQGEATKMKFNCQLQVLSSILE